MNLKGNTVLITGGTSGIGLHLAKELVAKGNTVLVTGRDSSNIGELRSLVPNAHFYESDVADPLSIISLYEKVIRDFPNINILINNAGIMRTLNLNTERHDLEDIAQEITIDLVGEIRMVEQFLSHLKTKPQAAILNVSSGLAFISYPTSPIYSAAKAGVHAYTQALRVQLKNTKVQVFELAPPAVHTPLMDKLGSQSLNNNSKGLMDVSTLVKAVIKGMEKNTYEILPGRSKQLKLLSRLAPNLAVRIMALASAKDLKKMQE